MRLILQFCLLLLVLLGAETHAWGKVHVGQNIASGGLPVFLVDCTDGDAPPALITQGDEGRIPFRINADALDDTDAAHKVFFDTSDAWSHFKINAVLTLGPSALMAAAKTPGLLMSRAGIPAANTATRWGPATGAGPLGEGVAATFRGGSYTQMVTQEATTLYRAYGGKAGELGSNWTTTAPAGPLQTRPCFRSGAIRLKVSLRLPSPREPRSSTVLPHLREV